jgi:hypothetical protein
MSMKFFMLVIAMVAITSAVGAVDTMHAQGSLVAPGVLPMDPSMRFTPPGMPVNVTAVNITADNVSTFTINDLSFM